MENNIKNSKTFIGWIKPYLPEYSLNKGYWKYHLLWLLFFSYLVGIAIFIPFLIDWFFAPDYDGKDFRYRDAPKDYTIILFISLASLIVYVLLLIMQTLGLIITACFLMIAKDRGYFFGIKQEHIITLLYFTSLPVYAYIIWSSIEDSPFWLYLVTAFFYNGVTNFIMVMYYLLGWYLYIYKSNVTKKEILRGGG